MKKLHTMWRATCPDLPSVTATTMPASKPLQNGAIHLKSTNGVNGHTHTNSNSDANGTPRVPKRLYSISRPPSLSAFKTLCSQSTNPETYPLASTIASNIPVYDLTYPLPNADIIDALQDEWHHILLSGPGVFVLRKAYTNTALLSRINDVFSTIIDSEASTSNPKGDHFAASGNNSRIWNSFQKHALADPVSFTQYYSNPWLSKVYESWLGRAYQITAQVNIVKPGGKPQVSHRDYHLGFQTAEECSSFPKAMQIASQFLTLQGAVAHSDMPLDSGPTRFLPFSQQFEEGFMAYRIREFQEYFNENWVSVGLEKGDAVFFNPALHHAAGENRTTDVERGANLLQVSSAFGKTMESIDTLAIISKCWDEVRNMYDETGTTEDVEAILKAIGNGYPFPTNLDQRPPAPSGMAPESEIDLLHRALTEQWDTEKVVSAISIMQKESMS